MGQPPLALPLIPKVIILFQWKSIMAGKGGRTPGAGRKPNKINLLRKSIALGLLSEEQEKNRWTKFLNHSNDELAFRAFIAWNERAYGKCPQAMEHSTKDDEPLQLLIRHVGSRA